MSDIYKNPISPNKFSPTRARRIIAKIAKSAMAVTVGHRM